MNTRINGTHKPAAHSPIYTSIYLPITTSVRLQINIFIDLSIVTTVKKSMNSKDKLAEMLLKTLNEASEPLETKEIEKKLPTATRSKIFSRLIALVIAGVVKGKRVGSGNGTWIWWKKDGFTKGVSESKCQ